MTVTRPGVLARALHDVGFLMPSEAAPATTKKRRMPPQLHIGRGSIVVRAGGTSHEIDYGRFCDLDFRLSAPTLVEQLGLAGDAP